MSQYQKVKTNLVFTEARNCEWQWHQLGHMQVCTLRQTNNHASAPPLSFFTGRMPFLPPNQQRQSTEGKVSVISPGNVWSQPRKFSSYSDFCRPVWARECCSISPPCFLAKCCKRQLNQVSLVLLYFRLSAFSDLY